MSRPVIVVDDLSKSYRLGARSQRADSLREAITQALMSPLRRFRESSEVRADEAETFWALKGVSFEIHPGEVVGIIGRNGAGKSTLLKILSRIVEPTSGGALLRGRVASLLEVGTGFHPELTGRENIFLNGSILGMKHAEIARKFDEIVAFAEISKFLDTPVKRYSSGMYVRLAFAVAAHLEPEILIIDEVLAVGDNNFQKKCLSKMQSISGQGRTVIFVSHNMNTVTRICPRAILLHQGRIIADGTADEVTRVYLRSDQGSISIRTWDDPATAPGNGIARLRSARVVDQDGNVVEVLDIRKTVGLEVVFDVLEPGHVLVPNMPVINEEGVCVFHLRENDPYWHRRPRDVGRYTSTVWIPGNFLAEGMLVVGVALSTMDPVRIHFFESDSIAFQVVDTHDGDSVRGEYTGPFPGVVRPMLEWSTDYQPEMVADFSNR
jgi:lipopolysaccharide transport system ATP-binding protein